MRHRLAAVLLCVAVSCTNDPTVPPRTVDEPWQARGFVAHAFGSTPNGTILTESLKAFNHSYHAGFRAFEVDLVQLKDRSIALAHDGRESHYDIPEGVTFDQLTAEELRGRTYDRYWPLLLEEDLIELIVHHPDAVFLLDAKGDPETTQVEIAERIARMAPLPTRARLYPHVHSEEQLTKLRALRLFPDFVLALYLWRDRPVSDAPGFVRMQKLRTVILRPQDYSERLRRDLAAAGARWIFMTSFTTREEIEPWRAKGLGVYSNDWIEPA